MKPQSAAAVSAAGVLAPVDWRVERLTSLMGQDWLAGEWDGERQLIVPSPGGRLTRVLRCVVDGCPRDRHGSAELCHLHGRQFAASDIGHLQDWLGSGEPAVIERRRCSDQRCAVADAGGTAAAVTGPAWTAAVQEQLVDERLRNGVPGLAVEPLHAGADSQDRYADAVLARMHEIVAARQVAVLKSRLQRSNPIEQAEEHARLFGELISLESYRRGLRERAIGDQ